ncbi:MAG: DMT family transporter [Rhodoglobus sp.]
MSSVPAARSAAVIRFAVAASVLFGVGVATQSRINGELARQLDDGYVAALISFGSGLVILCVAMAIMPSGRRGLGVIRSQLREGRMPWWYLFGGAAGAFLVLSQGLTAALLGIALFTVAIVCGQTLSGLLIDRSGIGAAAPKPITPTRLIGSALALVAVLFVVSAQLQSDIPLWALIMPFIGGIGIGWQQAVNGQVRVISGSPLTASFINFVVGTTALLIAAVIHVSIVGLPTALPTSPVLYLGGLVGVVFIAGAAIVAPITGVLLLGLGTIAGQLVASLLLDLFLPVASHQVTWITVLGTALTLVAVAIAALPSKRTTTN